MRYPILKSDGIILQEREIGEADKLFTLYTYDFGKILVLGKGIRKIQAKLRFALQVANLISLEFIKGKNFFIVTDAFLKDDFSAIKKEMKKFRQLLYILWILDSFLKEPQKDIKVWNLLIETIEKISKEKKGWLFLRRFEWRLLQVLGMGAELFFCLRCQKGVSGGKIYFSQFEGGIFCQKCHQRSLAEKSIAISHDALKILRLFFLNDKGILAKIKCSPSLKEEVRSLSRLLLSFFLEKEIYVIS